MGRSKLHTMQFPVFPGALGKEIWRFAQCAPYPIAKCQPLSRCGLHSLFSIRHTQQVHGCRLRTWQKLASRRSGVSAPIAEQAGSCVVRGQPGAADKVADEERKKGR